MELFDDFTFYRYNGDDGVYFCNRYTIIVSAATIILDEFSEKLEEIKISIHKSKFNKLVEDIDEFHKYLVYYCLNNRGYFVDIFDTLCFDQTNWKRKENRYTAEFTVFRDLSDENI